MEKFEVRNVKGANDCLPDDMVARVRVTDILRRNFENYGYLPLESACLNNFDLLSYKYGDDAEIVREIYKIKDQGDRDLGLRFDLTVPFAKIIAMNRNLRMPFKRYEIGKVWRNGPVKLGRVREFTQCDIDCVGASSHFVEVELILLAIKCFNELSIKPRIQIGHRALLELILQEFGVLQKDIEQVIAVLDKVKKQPLSETQSSLNTLVGEKITKHLISLTNLSWQDIQSKLNDNIKQSHAMQNLKEFETAIEKLNIIEYCEINIWLARGLNIYTGIVWEIFDSMNRLTSSIGSGGRYDNIITNFINNGQQYPAVGMSFGLEPIMTILKTDNNLARSIDIMIIPMKTEVECHQFASMLHQHSIKTLVYHGGKSVGKAMEYANANHIPFTCVLGDNEITTKCITIKNMTSGRSQQFKTNDSQDITKFLRGD